MSTALYRRYRPESFADVIGQAHVTEPLMQALRTGRVSHAYLFSGPRGCGKTTSARILARALNCEQGPTPIPCDVCESCVALARDGSGSIDVIEIDAASHGGVDDARDLRERAAYGPAISRYKIYIIDEAHMVTTQGFNALLKIVEEPPEYVKFIFATTVPEKVIGTIRSRTHHYPFRLVPPLLLQDYLGELCVAEKVVAAPGVLSFVVRAGGGSVRDSLSVLDQLIAGSGDEGLTYEGAAALLGFTEGELLDATVDGLTAADAGAVFRQIDKVIETGHDPKRFVEDLLERLRDLIVVAAVPDGASSVLRGVPEDQLERMRQQSGAFGPGALSRAADIVNAGLTEMTGATAPRLQLELICARVLLPGASGESGYAARLDRLERRLDMSGAATPAGPRSAPVSAPETQHQSADTAATTASATTASATTASATTASATTAPATLVHEPVPVVEAPLPAAPRATPTPGGIDTGAIRRSWPDVVTKVKTISRSTWTFVSESTTVLDYNGERLLLGLSTEGLLSALRGRNHIEVLRQALIEVIGVDTRIEGVISVNAAATDAAALDSSALDSSAPAAEAPLSAVSGDREPTSGDREPTSRDPEPDDGWQTPSSTSERTSSPEPSAAKGDLSSTPRQRARAAVAREASTRHTSSLASVADDSVVSADDENIEEAGAIGRPVIERVLGGTLIGELDQ